MLKLDKAAREAAICMALSGSLFPENERQNLEFIASNLSLLRQHVESVDASVALFQYCEANWIHGGPFSEIAIATRMKHNKMLRAWKSIAARNGALSIYDFFRRARPLTN